jgi:hypothetical protein
MKNLFNIISSFAYHISILVYITIIVVLIYTQNTKSRLDPAQYESEAGFNYLEDTDVFD